ncbi:MAG: hypothetical protein HKN24_00970 [Acidimicrobiales bacterium]|nr:hypothetical protein [Acidimicrobiales bacterium]
MISQTGLLLGGAGLMLALIAVIIDRLNFPQRRFIPKRVWTYGEGPFRDRTGAHIVEIWEDEEI